MDKKDKHILINWHVHFVGAKSSQLVWCDLDFNWLWYI